MAKNVKKICLQCPKKVHCCKFDNPGFVFIGIKDALKIRKRYNLRYKDFLEFRKFSKKKISLLARSEEYNESHMRLKQLRKDHLLVLKTKKNKDCIFFDKGCKIYQYRPLICRIYPYWFFLGEKRHIISHDGCSGCKILKHDKGLAVLKKDELKQLIGLSKKIQAEDRYYRKNIDKFVKEI